MNKSLEQVKEFHEMFNHLIGNLNDLEPIDIRQLRVKLLFEELLELSVASDCKKTMYDLCNNINISKEDVDGDNVDKIEELDALCDIQYVLNGKILTSGLYSCFDNNFDIVHENNMTKLHNSVEHAEETIRSYNKNSDSLSYKHVKDKVIVLNDSGKVIKPFDHKKVKLNIL